MLVAILSKRGNMTKLGNLDVYVNIIGGVKVTDPGLDLAAALAIMSSYYNYIIPSNYLALGEIGLGGEIRKCSYMADRLNEAKKYGIKYIIGPSNYKNKDQDISYIGFNQIKDLVSWIKEKKGE
jgi:DNA repair protein RadA/Sms